MATAMARAIFSISSKRESTFARSTPTFANRFVSCSAAISAWSPNCARCCSRATTRRDSARCLRLSGNGARRRAADHRTRAKCGPSIFLGRRGDSPARIFTSLQRSSVPILALTVDAAASPIAPRRFRAPGTLGEYVAPSIDRDALRGRFFTHLVDCSRGVEIAVGRHLRCCAKTSPPSSRATRPTTL